MVFALERRRWRARQQAPTGSREAAGVGAQTQFKNRKTWKLSRLWEPLLLCAPTLNWRNRMRGLDLEKEAAKTSLQEEAKMKVNKSLEVFGCWANTLAACQDSVVLSAESSAFMLIGKSWRWRDYNIIFQQWVTEAGRRYKHIATFSNCDKPAKVQQLFMTL